MSKTDAIVDKLYSTFDKIEEIKASIIEAITLAREGEVVVPIQFVDARTGVHGQGALKRGEFGGIRHKRKTSKYAKKTRKSRKNKK
jgi:hypothetical protein